MVEIILMVSTFFYKKGESVHIVGKVLFQLLKYSKKWYNEQNGS